MIEAVGDSSRDGELALDMPAVTMNDFVEVNRRRLKMPRKSTWFTPKLRAGLVVVEL